MRYLLLALLALACVRSERFVVKAPDGGPAILVTCPRGHDDCRTEATEGCPNGHEVVDGDLPAYAGVTASANRQVMLVRCTRPSQNSPERRNMSRNTDDS